MDLVLDLTAHAVSYISYIQDYIRFNVDKNPDVTSNSNSDQLWEVYDNINHNKFCLNSELESRLRDLTFASRQNLSHDKILSIFKKVADGLIVWLKTKLTTSNNFPDINNLPEKTLNFSPHNWRVVISKILYNHPAYRIELCDCLLYMPIQIIYCFGGGKLSLYDQRILQVWNILHEDEMLNDKDKKFNEIWWKGSDNNVIRFQFAKLLIENDQNLVTELIKTKNPVPFETFYPCELKEIDKSREKRLINSETTPKNPIKQFHRFEIGEMQDYQIDEVLDQIRMDVEVAIQSSLPHNDTTPHNLAPFDNARSKNIVGLALSGGGIRSASFNLGILQHLAEKDFLKYVDYLSTVSGGGYIGSWFISWIKDSGSVQKVTQRLNVKQSCDPMGEEVRPIRWLRMYSNYLTPNSGIMSSDSWTLGMTWLRNTLINLFMLVFMFCLVIILINLGYTAWKQYNGITQVNFLFLLMLGFVVQFPAIVFAGIGMHMYDKRNSRFLFFNLARHKHFSSGFGFYCFIMAAFIAAWMVSNQNPHNDFYTFLVLLIPVSIIGCLGLIITALIGNYSRYWKHRKSRFRGYFYMIISSIVAALIGLLLLSLIWYIISYYPKRKDFWFIVGPPLVLECYAIVIVTRMAVMGNYFSDGRREWWGKMGGIFHRLSMVWIIATFCSLVLAELLSKLIVILLPAGLTWLGLVIWGVKLAFNSSGKNGPNSLSMKENFVRFAPYLFILGFIVFCSLIVSSFYEDFEKNYNLGYLFIFWVCLCLFCIWLGCRIGVNEFSLHYFYRNRLIRAFLGAVRKRTERNRTANDFTGFDDLDDNVLCRFRPAQDYFGPYPIINATLNCSVVSYLDRQDRKAESFIFSPLFCGFDVSPTRSASFNNNSFDYGYRPTEKYAYEDGPTLGTSMAISGAAVSPNRGYHSSPATAFLLTVFNVRLGWWMGNPRLDKWKSSDPSFGIAYLIKDIIGKSTTNSDYVYLSDGGHFDNMGIYELIRRRCKYIILSDAEEDIDAKYEGLANAIRRCYIDFGAIIEIPAFEQMEKCPTHIIYGNIRYAGEPEPSGLLIYIKSCLTGDEPTDIKEYHSKNKTFPHQSTGDQFFDEEQFESYRKLGWHSLAKKS